MANNDNALEEYTMKEKRITALILAVLLLVGGGTADIDS